MQKMAIEDSSWYLGGVALIGGVTALVKTVFGSSDKKTDAELKRAELENSRDQQEHVQVSDRERPWMELAKQQLVQIDSLHKEFAAMASRDAANAVNLEHFTTRLDECEADRRAISKRLDESERARLDLERRLNESEKQRLDLADRVARLETQLLERTA